MYEKYSLSLERRLGGQLTFVTTVISIIGLFIYYISNLFNVMGSTEKIPLMISIWTPIIFLALVYEILNHDKVQLPCLVI